MKALRDITHHNSLIVILWGLIFAKCFTLEYFVQVYVIPINSALYIWALTLSMATAATFVFVRLKTQEGSFQNTFRRNLVIWGSVSIAMLIVLAVVFTSQSINPYITPSLLAMPLGAGYITQGRSDSNLIYIFSGIGWWIGAGILCAQSAVQSLLLFACLILALSVCPIALQMIRSKQHPQPAGCH